ncbi:unnamed protein product [Moneuplotes crassus]|uniref:K Homology domain-containing protein n=2 Tax=Euplotes crassus TaxID=5936 RepID=A0AAD1UJ42_EUPCR|nr:unnamed protein product [Moneuplotes crassus]
MANPLIVEVQDELTYLWFTATIQDIQEGKFVVKYTDPSFDCQEEAVQEGRVRWNSVFKGNCDIDYEEDSYVEVRHRPSEGEPLGWCLAKIIHKRGNLYFVHYENYENIYDEIVVQEQIRPVNDRGCIEIDELKRGALKVPGPILSWATTDDCVEKLNNVIAKTGIYNASFRPEDAEIVFIGEKKPVDRAIVLISFVIDHQKDLAQIDINHNNIAKSIENKKAMIKNQAVEEVLVPRDVLGIIIGKAGANLNFIKQEYKVNIQIIEADAEDVHDYTDTIIPENKALIRIFGNNRNWVAEAKSYICINKNTYPIEKDKIDYFRGYKNSILNDMKERSGCVKIFVHDPIKGSNEGEIEAIGNEESLENLRLLIETHMDYYDTYQDKESENVELITQKSKYNSYGKNFYTNDDQKGAGGNKRKPKRGRN